MRVSRRNLLLGSAALAAAGLHTSNQAEATRPHNFVFIIIDDLLSFVYDRHRFGVNIRTPGLNRLMDTGVTFTNAFASTALCNPSRTSILSGMNPFRSGVNTNGTAWEEFVDPHLTFPGILAANGWRCFSYGKVAHGNNKIFRKLRICEEVVKRPDNPAADKEAVTDAINCIRRELVRADEPWLLMVGLRGPHKPSPDNPEFLSYYPLEQIAPLNWDGDPPPVPLVNYDRFVNGLEPSGLVREFIQAYLADVTAMDRQLQRLVDALDARGLNFTLILTSDHGYMLGHHDSIGKQTLWDDACRAPLIIRYPGCPERLTIPETVSLLDIAPSILRRANIPVPAYMDGESLLTLIKRRDLLRTSGAMTTMDESLSFRDNRYRITRYAPGGELELYDQLLDGDSRNNLADNPAYDQVKATMLAKLDACYARWTS